MLTSSLILVLADFAQSLLLQCDASKVGIGTVLSQGNHSVTYFSEKLTVPKSRYNTYDVDSYAIVCAIYHWRHDLFHKEIVLFTDHDALKHLGTKTRFPRGKPPR